MLTSVPNEETRESFAGHKVEQHPRLKPVTFKGKNLD
jgi:hypothetical protein